MQSVLVYDLSGVSHYRLRTPGAGLTDWLGALSQQFSRQPQQSPWLARIDGRIKELRSLQQGWDGYDAPPISPAVLAFAQSVLQSVMTPQCPPPSLVPTHGGGVQLEWHVAGGDVELMIYRPAEASLSASFADGRDSIDDEPLNSDFGRLSIVLNEIG